MTFNDTGCKGLSLSVTPRAGLGDPTNTNFNNELDGISRVLLVLVSPLILLFFNLFLKEKIDYLPIWAF